VTSTVLTTLGTTGTSAGTVVTTSARTTQSTAATTGLTSTVPITLGTTGTSAATAITTSARTTQSTAATTGLTSTVPITLGTTGTSAATAITTSGRTMLSTAATTSAAVTGTTTKRCEEMQAVDEETSKKITVTPIDVPQREKPDFQPSSNKGVSFPEEQKRPTITVNFGKPAEVQSVTIPRDKTPNANVQRFEVTFYAPDGSKINERPIQSSTSPKDDNKKPASVDSSQIPSDRKVSRVEITIISTTNDRSPKGVVIDIKACTEMSTGKYYSR
jgi:hypothetical protein